MRIRGYDEEMLLTAQTVVEAMLDAADVVGVEEADVWVPRPGGGNGGKAEQ